MSFLTDTDSVCTKKKYCFMSSPATTTIRLLILCNSDITFISINSILQTHSPRRAAQFQSDAKMIVRAWPILMSAIKRRKRVSQSFFCVLRGTVRLAMANLASEGRICHHSPQSTVHSPRPGRQHCAAKNFFHFQKSNPTPAPGSRLLAKIPGAHITGE